MTTHRVHKNKNYSVIHNEAVLNSEMTWKAKGLLWYLLSRPDGWECKTEDLVKRSPQGEEAVTSGLRELEEHGYIIRWKEKDEKGRFKYFSEVFEVKADCDRWKTENAERIGSATRFKTRPGKPRAGQNFSSGETSPGKSSSGKPASLVITNRSSTEGLNTEGLNTPPIVPQAKPEQTESEPCVSLTSLGTAGDSSEAIANPEVPELATGTPESLTPVNPKEFQIQNQGLGSENKRVPPAACDTFDANEDPAPWNFDVTAARYDRRPSPILEHYGLGHLAIARVKGRVQFAPRLIDGVKKVSQGWSSPLKLDGEAIAHLAKRLAQLQQEHSYQAAIAFLEQAWEVGSEQALGDAQKREEVLLIPEWEPRPITHKAKPEELGFLRGKGTLANFIGAKRGAVA